VRADFFSSYMRTTFDLAMAFITITCKNNSTSNSRRIDTSFCSKIQGKDELFCVTMFILKGIVVIEFLVFRPYIVLVLT
jgi:hypothetical protein